MLDQLLLTVNSWMTASLGPALVGSFIWGMVSVLLSPCHMASIPLIIAYVAGQKVIPAPRRAAGYAALFAAGLFLTIMAVGLVCAAAGRMLGDVGPWWQAVVGVVLLWVAWTLFQPPQCATNGRLLSRFQFQGAQGALILGLAYGLLSGVCTFGFIAPILGVITLQKEIVTGVAMLAFFSLGHVLPLVLCGMFSARTMELLHSRAGQKVVAVSRRLAAVVIAGLGFYFIAVPFL